MDDATPLGERIAYYRRRRGLSQVKLAGLLGRSESWLSQVERGVRSIDRISVLTQVAAALNVPVTELSPDPLVQEHGGRAPDRPGGPACAQRPGRARPAVRGAGRRRGARPGGPAGEGRQSLGADPRLPLRGAGRAAAGPDPGLRGRLPPPDRRRPPGRLPGRRRRLPGRRGDHEQAPSGRRGLGRRGPVDRRGRAR